MIEIAGRRLEPTPAFDAYWRFAAERQRIYLARLAGDPAPWTTDPVLATHRFTNCYRAADRVSQHLITQVSYRGSQDPTEVLFRTLMFRIYNRVSTWQALTAALGEGPDGLGERRPCVADRGRGRRAAAAPRVRRRLAGVARPRNRPRR